MKKLSVTAGGIGALAAIWLAPSAAADPVVPIPPPPAPPAADPAVPAPPTAEGVPHLASPENLPPDTSLTPAGPRESSGVTYLREMWHAIQTQEISGRDALLLLTQRPLSADSAPPAGVPVNPTPPAAAPVDSAPPAPGQPLPPPPPAPAPAPAPVAP